VAVIDERSNMPCYAQIIALDQASIATGPSCGFRNDTVRPKSRMRVPLASEAFHRVARDWETGFTPGSSEAGRESAGRRSAARSTKKARKRRANISFDSTRLDP